MDLLKDEEWLRKAIEAEDKVGGNIGAGLDWGTAFGELMVNLELRERILAVLEMDELYCEEFISERQILRELIGVLLTQSDWETIAAVAADSLKAQIMQQVSFEKISA